MPWAGGVGEDVLAKFTSSVSLDNKGHGWVGKKGDMQVREECIKYVTFYIILVYYIIQFILYYIMLFIISM